MISFQVDKDREDSPEVTPISHSDFSIDHILNKAGRNSNSSSKNCSGGADEKCDQVPSSVTLNPLPWLRCTRYCPPRVPRGHKREGPQKRQLGRHPRIPFTTHQLQILEKKYQQSPYLSSEEVIDLSKKLDLTDTRVKIWFQNRRARERREKSVPNLDSNRLSPKAPDTATTRLSSASELSGSPVPGTLNTSLEPFGQSLTSNLIVPSAVSLNRNNFTIFEPYVVPFSFVPSPNGSSILSRIPEKES